jgi:hypothetical protein
MNIPAGVVQYPKAEDAPGDKVSYSLLMSFDGERSSRSSGLQTVLGHHPGSGLGHGAKLDRSTCSVAQVEGGVSAISI